MTLVSISVRRVALQLAARAAVSIGNQCYRV